MAQNGSEVKGNRVNKIVEVFVFQEYVKTKKAKESELIKI